MVFREHSSNNGTHDDAHENQANKQEANSPVRYNSPELLLCPTLPFVDSRLLGSFGGGGVDVVMAGLGGMASD
jgi:hypothetical protein